MNLFQIIVDVVMVLIIALLVILGIKRGLVKSFFRSTKINKGVNYDKYRDCFQKECNKGYAFG